MNNAEIMQARLSRMAWDELNIQTGPVDPFAMMQRHVQKMLEILRSPEKFRRLCEKEAAAPCQYCHGTGKHQEDEAKATIRQTVAELQNNPQFLDRMRKSLQRCPKCNSSGVLCVDPKTYCDCQMGRDIEATDRRLHDEAAWGLAQQPSEKTRPI